MIHQISYIETTKPEDWEVLKELGYKIEELKECEERISELKDEIRMLKENISSTRIVSTSDIKSITRSKIQYDAEKYLDGTQISIQDELNKTSILFILTPMEKFIN